ncbi:MAG: hypothetical protein C4291_14900 [Candidatus Dadabacteria bacterium]
MNTPLNLTRESIASIFNSGVAIIYQDMPSDQILSIADVAALVSEEIEVRLKQSYIGLMDDIDLSYWADMIARVAVLGFILPTVCEYSPNLQGAIIDGILNKLSMCAKLISDMPDDTK